MHSAYSLLIVDDEASIRRLLQKELAAPHRRVLATGSAREALQMCREESFDVVLLDIRMPDGNGLELLPSFLGLLPDARIIMITGHADVDSAVTAMRNGAYDFVAKPFTLDKLELVVERAVEHSMLARENRSLRLSSGGREPELIGASAALRELTFLLRKVAPTDVPVLITGESGTGKDVAAAGLHAMSPRARLPFVVKNCAGLQKELARSELFGHVRGAFTNALESSEGLMTVAHRGTLFLDEVGELPLEVQGQLLRVLESRRYRRVGEKEERSVDVRFLFATNRNLAQEVQRGCFHEAFLHRINVFQVHLPPLRDRREDIPLLVRHFLSRLGGGAGGCSVTPGAMERLLCYHWPGNVRELRNVIERGIILAEEGVISERALPHELVASLEREGAPACGTAVPHGGSASPDQTQATKIDADLPTLEEVERRHILRALARSGGNKQEAAKMLGIARKTLYRKLSGLKGERQGERQEERQEEREKERGEGREKGRTEEKAGQRTEG